MARLSAGLLVFRRLADRVEVLLVHMGGPFWARKDAGAWSIPKGEYDGAEEPLSVARREFREELGLEPPPGDPRPLGEIRQRGGKIVRAWAVEGDMDVSAIRSNTFSLEWPPKSGRVREFAEVDRAAWVDVETARTLLVAGQVPLLDALARLLDPQVPGRGEEEVIAR